MAKTKLSNNYKRLTKQLPDLEENIKQGKINVVPLKRLDKYPLITDWNNREYSLTESFTYKNRYGKEYTQVGLKYHTGNYGILIGYGNKENGYSIGCIDIDGYKTSDDNPDLNLKAETQKYIYEALKELPNSLQVKTQSGGYHIYFWTKKVEPSTSKTSHSLSFPPDFPIESLAGKPLKDSIEIFTNHDKKQTVLPSSTIMDKATKNLREYKVIGTVNKFADIEVLDDINETVINHLTSKGYTYQPEPITVPSNNPSKQPKRKHTRKESNLRKLKKAEIDKVSKLVIPIWDTVTSGRNDTVLALGGYFSKHITRKSAEKICNKIIKAKGSILGDTSNFKRSFLTNYDRKTETKTGLPTVCKAILQANNQYNVTEFTDGLESICNSSFSKEIVGDCFINETQIPIILYEDSKTKWLKYMEIFTGIDLILNLNTHIGSFRDSKTDKEITSFTFKFNNKFFDLKKKDLEMIDNFLSFHKAELPDFFTEIIRTSLNNLEKYITNPKELSREVTLKGLLKSRDKEGLARQLLGNYLHENGTVLRRGINKPYIKNKYNGYDSVETDDILEFLYSTGEFEINTIHTDDITKALGFISERIKPSYNIVKFPNCLYDIKNFEVLETPDKPILTLTEVQYNYNPEAKGKLVVEFLETSLHQDGDTPEILQDRVTAVYEFIGYLLISGNPKFAWFIITGIGGAGKGVFTRLIISIFGTDKVGDLKLQELTPDNKFATAHLESKIINIVRDSPKKPIEDTGMLKAITGYDDIGIEPKGKDKYILPKEEVPDMVTVCNNIPRFKEGFDESILQRAIVFEFLNRFRGTDNQNENLEEEILSNPEEMEYLIYQSIQAYKDMVENKRDFKARIDETKTMELLGKHTDPITYILPKLVRYNPRADEDGEDNILPNELNKLVLFVAEKEGLNITGLNKKGEIKSNILIGAIRREFNFDKDYKTVSKQCIYNELTNKMEYARVYPLLCKTTEYDDYLQKMEDEKKD